MFRKCLKCGKRSSPIRESVYTLAGEHKLRFCSECWRERTEYRSDLERERALSREKETAKRAEEFRLAELRRKVDLHELEAKARKYGID